MWTYKLWRSILLFPFCWVWPWKNHFGFFFAVLPFSILILYLEHRRRFHWSLNRGNMAIHTSCAMAASIPALLFWRCRPPMGIPSPKISITMAHLLFTSLLPLSQWKMEPRSVTLMLCYSLIWNPAGQYIYKHTSYNGITPLTSIDWTTGNAFLNCGVTMDHLAGFTKPDGTPIVGCSLSWTLSETDPANIKSIVSVVPMQYFWILNEFE